MRLVVTNISCSPEIPQEGVFRPNSTFTACTEVPNEDAIEYMVTLPSARDPDLPAYPAFYVRGNSSVSHRRYTPPASAASVMSYKIAL